MTTDEAKGLFALMNWDWESKPLSWRGRARMPERWQGRYDTFVNEVMVEERRKLARQLGSPDPAYSSYEDYDLDRCLTRYAEIYTEYIANKKD